MTTTNAQRNLLIVKVAVFLDMLAVGIFMPLLPYYWKELGIRPAMLGLVTSVYQVSQIVSGIVLGWVGDHVLGRKTALLLSFLGSAVSYFLAGLAYYQAKHEASEYGIIALIVSRVIVGLVKQTMTISKAVIISLVSDSDRTTALSHLRACSTLAFMAGPTIGGHLARWSDNSVPAFVAAAIFCFNYLLILLLLPQQEIYGAHPAVSKSADKGVKGDSDLTKLTPPPPPSVSEGLRGILKAEGLAALTSIKFFNTLCISALYVVASRSVADKYGLEPYHMGYLSSAQSLMSFASQTVAVGAITRRFGEGTCLRGGFLLCTLLAVIESLNQSVILYICLLPIRVLTQDTITQMFESLFTASIPASEAGAALGGLGLLKSIARVAGPLYGGLLFGYVEPLLGHSSRPVVECFHNTLVLVALLIVPLRGAAKTKVA